MSLSIRRVVVAGALGLHTIAHAGALASLLRQALGAAPEFAARSWLLPDAPASIAAAIAGPFWLVAAVAFATAALSFWGFAVPVVGWRELAVCGAVASILGLAVLSGHWPGSPDAFYSTLNVAVALAMNLVILGSLLWFRWRPREVHAKPTGS